MVYIKEKIGFVNACSLYFGITIGCIMAPILKTYYLHWNINIKIVSYLLNSIYVIYPTLVVKKEIKYFVKSKLSSDQ